MKEVTTGQSGIEFLIFRLMQLTAAVVVKKSLSFQMLTDLKIRRGTYRGRHPVWYVYYTLRVLGNALGVQGSG